MAKTSLFSSLRRLAKKSLITETDLSRREFLQKASITTAGLAMAPLLGCSSKLNFFSGNSPSIAIVGAGLAGTACAYRLEQAGITADLYEASERIGGRTFSLRNHFADGQTAELGGELIDSNHQSVFRLIQELGLQLDDCRENTHDHDHFIVDQQILSEQWILENFKPLAQNILKVRAQADLSEEYFNQIDRLSIREWLDSQADLDARLKKLLISAYTGEFGLEADEQSAINLLYFIDPESQSEFKIFGESDERYHIRNGNDQMATGMAKKLSREIHFNHRLVALEQNNHGYRLHFQREAKTIAVNYDLVVLALPFTLLRQIDLQDSGFLPDKLSYIQQLGYGTNAKIMAGFNSRPWNKFTDNFALIADDPVQTIWETSRAQPGDSGIITNFLGGHRGLHSGKGTAHEQFLPSLNQLEKNFKGLKQSYLPNQTVRMHWPSHPLTLGSYTCYRPGQAALAGLEGRREGNVFFCGEHCSIEFQGFMEGALQTGETTAAEIIKTL